jgi:uncharacterized membrane protein YqhA
MEVGMGKFLAGTRFLVLVGVIALLVTSLAAFGWGVIRMVNALMQVLSPVNEASITVALIEVADAFLLATALLIFAYGLYELFISELKLPAWIQIHNLHDLEAKLGGILVLVMSVKFLEKLAEWKNATETLFFALAIALVAAILIAFNVFGKKD